MRRVHGPQRMRWHRAGAGKYVSDNGLYTIELVDGVWVWNDHDYRDGVYRGEAPTYNLAKKQVDMHDYWKACWD